MTRHTRRKMSDTNDLMAFTSARLGTTLEEIYQRLVDFNFAIEDQELAMFTVALLNAMGREGRGNRPTEVVLILSFRDSGTAERGQNRLMRWRRLEKSDHDLAREPGLGQQRDHRLGEMPYLFGLCNLSLELSVHVMSRAYRIRRILQQHLPHRRYQDERIGNPDFGDHWGPG